MASFPETSGAQVGCGIGGQDVPLDGGANLGTQKGTQESHDQLRLAGPLEFSASGGVQVLSAKWPVLSILMAR